MHLAACLVASLAVARALQAVLVARASRPSRSALRHLCHAEQPVVRASRLSPIARNLCLAVPGIVVIIVHAAAFASFAMPAAFNFPVLV